MFKSQARFHLSLLIVSVLLLETIVQPALALQAALGGQGVTVQTAAAQTSEAALPSAAELSRMQQQYNNQVIEAMRTGYGGRDPAMRDLMSLDISREKGMIPDFSNAPVDQDPFFMRSQKWESSNTSVNDYAVASDERSTEISLPNSARKLVLDLPLRSLIATNDYLFFTLHPKSDLFDRLSGVPNSEGEGLFVIETALLATHASRGTPVPVHFLPIMGKGWRTNMTAMQIVQGDILAISNGIEVIPFLMKDIRELIQISKINLDVSVMISLTKLGPDRKVADERLIPAPGSTALLGLVVTGLDSTRPGYNFFRDFRAVASNAVSSRFQKYAFLEKLLGIEKAQAQEGGDPVTAAIMKSLFFGGIVAVTVVTAFALKYKSKGVRQRLDEIQKYRRALDPERVDAEKMKGLREWLRIEGSILASIAQFPLISPGIATQYFVDRHMPNLGSGDHTLMRKVLNQTIYPNLRHFGKISVNDKVTVLGTGYAATAGVGLGALHYFYLLPMFVTAVAPTLPQGLGFALTDTFNPANRETTATLFTNLLVGASIGILRGPADFTMDAKSQVVEELYARVDNDLRRLGINPNDPKVQSRREEMRESLVNLTLLQKGLPSSAEILFDTMSLYSTAASARGFSKPTNDALLANVNPLSTDVTYELDKDGNKKLGEDGKPIVQESNFILTSRRGLLPSVLNRALTQAQAWNRLSPSPDTAQAVRLVEKIIADSERLRNILPKVAQALLRQAEFQKQGAAKADRTADLAKLHQEIREISARALAFRQLLVMSNYEGPIEYTARYLPVTWSKEFGPAATNMAALYLRQALASQLDGATVDNIAAKREDILSYQERAQVEAIEEMRKQNPKLLGLSETEILANPNLRAEALQRSNIIVKKHGEDQRAQESANRYEPKDGWIEQWRHRSALEKAEARLAQYALQNAGQPDLLKQETLEARLREFYILESGKQIGLHIEGYGSGTERSKNRAPWQSDNEKYETMLAEIQEKTELLAKQQLESRDVKTYIAKLTPIDATRLKLQLQASIFLSAYRDATTMTDVVSALDPAQPGFTQGVRQALTRQTAKDLKILEEREAQRTNALDRKLLQVRRSVVSMAASTANRGLRIIDSMFNDQAIDRGALGVIQRRVPFAEEFVSANIRNLKFWPVAFTVSWTWSHFALGTGISYSFWVTSILFQGVFAMLPVQWLFRNYRMQSFKPYDSNKPGWAGVFHLGGKYGLSEFLAYAVTFVAVMPAVMVHTQVGQDLTRYVGGPIAQSMSSFTPTEIAAALMASMLTYLAGSKAYEKWKMRSTMNRLNAFDEIKKSTESTSLLRPSADRVRCEMMFTPAN